MNVCSHIEVQKNNKNDKMWQALKICVRVAQPASRHEKKQLHVSFYDSVHEIPVDQNGRWLNPSIQQKVEGLICYDPMWWGWGELGARLNPRNHKPVRMFNAQNHRGGSSKMLVKRWSSNIQHTFCQSVTGANKTFSTNMNLFEIHPDHMGFYSRELDLNHEPNGTPSGRASRQSVEKLSFQCLWKMPEV